MCGAIRIICGLQGQGESGVSEGVRQPKSRAKLKAHNVFIIPLAAIIPVAAAPVIDPETPAASPAT